MIIVEMISFGLDRITCSSEEDWRALVRTRANVLVIGRRDALDAFVATCRNELRDPVVRTSATRRLVLLPSGTLVIDDLEQLDRAGQRALTAGINAREHADTQIISLAVIPISPLIKADRFDPHLFYRLNTICLDLRTSRSASDEGSGEEN